MSESENWYALYHSTELRERRSRSHRSKYLIFGLPQGVAGELFLDLCCGAGEFSRLLAQFNPGSQVLASDLRPVVEAPGSRNPLFLAAEAAFQPLPSASVDRLFCFHALHHLGRIDRWIPLTVELARLLRSGGTLHLVDHYPSPWLRLARLAFSSPLGSLSPWMRNFRAQLKQEREILDYWLIHWESFFSLLEQAGFARLEFRRELFVFYAVYRKG